MSTLTRTFRQAALLTAAAAIGLVVLWWANRPATFFDDRVYRVGVDHAPPFYYLEQGKPVRGMAVDVLNEVARRLDMRLQWVPTAGSLDEALETKKVDLWPVVSIRDERKHRLHLTEPWLENRFCLFSLAERNIWSAKDTAGKRIGHLRFPQTVALAERYLPAATLFPYDDRRSVVTAICEAKVEAGFVEARFVDTALSKRPPGCETAEFRVAVVDGATVQMAVAAHPDAAAAADWIRDEIAGMAVLLASQAGAFVTGQTIIIDGGVMAA